MKKIIAFVVTLTLLFSVPAFAEEDVPIGRWTIASSYDELSGGFMLGKTDLIFFDDGNVFRFTVTKRKKDNDITISHDSGIWIGDRENIIIRFNNKTFNAYIDDDGFLYLENDDITTMFLRIKYDKEPI